MKIDWFLGFSEGEGNFSVIFTSKKGKDENVRYAWPKVCFQLRQKEKKVLEYDFYIF